MIQGTFIMMYAICLMILLDVIMTSYAYPTGAPTIACVSMTPNHDVLAQKGSSPYIIDIGGATTYTPKTTITGNF